MDDPGIESELNPVSNTQSYMQNTTTSSPTMSSIQLNNDLPQQKMLRSILPRPSENLELVVERDSAQMPDVAGAKKQYVFVEEVYPRPSINVRESTKGQTTRSKGNSMPVAYKEGEESEESLEDSEDSDFEDFDSDDADSHQDDLEPSTSEPRSSTPSAANPSGQVRKADTLFTKTELIALGVAYATEASWPRIAEYFPHRTPRSLYQTFKLTFIHSGNGHKLARDSFPPGADIPELRKKFQTLRKLASRTRRVPHEYLPDGHDQDVIRGPLSLTRWQKKDPKFDVNGEIVAGQKATGKKTTGKKVFGKKVVGKKVAGEKAAGEKAAGKKVACEKPVQKTAVKEQPISARKEHIRTLQEEWKNEDDESDFEDVRATGAGVVKKELIKKERIDPSENPIIKMEDETTASNQSTGLPESSIIDLDAPSKVSESIPTANVQDISESRTSISETSLEGNKNRLIEQLSQCENSEDFNQVLINGLKAAELKGKTNRLIEQLSRCEDAEELQRVLMGGLENVEPKVKRKMGEDKFKRPEKRLRH